MLFLMLFQFGPFKINQLNLAIQILLDGFIFFYLLFQAAFFLVDGLLFLLDTVFSFVDLTVAFRMVSDLSSASLRIVCDCSSASSTFWRVFLAKMSLPTTMPRIRATAPVMIDIMIGSMNRLFNMFRNDRVYSANHNVKQIPAKEGG
jgi:hypothetical protein